MKTKQFLLLLILSILALNSCRKDKLIQNFEGTYELLRIGESCCYAELVADTLYPGGYYTTYVDLQDTILDTIKISRIEDQQHTMLITSQNTKFEYGQFDIEAVLKKDSLIIEFQEFGVYHRYMKGHLLLDDDNISLNYKWVYSYSNSPTPGGHQSGTVQANGVRL